MKLIEVLAGVPLADEIEAEAHELEIEGIAFNANECKKGWLFFALEGVEKNGTDYIADAVKAGAIAVVSRTCVCTSVYAVRVINDRRALAVASANFYGNAHRELKIIAVTGTNGKTSTCKMISEILRYAGKSVAVFGTLGIFINDRKLDCSLTTPDPPELHRAFEIAYLAGVEYVVMEVSAHALYLEKLYGVRFAIAVFTNLTRDHLDFFGDMESYFSAKRKLFTVADVGFAVVNSDDAYGRSILESSYLPIATYGIYNPADVFAIDATYSKGTRCVVNCFDDIFRLDTHFNGEFNLYNALASITVARLLSVETKDIIGAFMRMREADGRFNVIDEGRRVIIDYAHTPDGLENLLKSARPLTEGKLIVVFGCGGNRDHGKRPLMGGIAGKYADFCILTSDNPRYEDPLRIIEEIEEGVIAVGGKYAIVPDRESAVNYAVTLAEKDDVIVLAGKGAEDYIEEKGVKHPYSDKNAVLNALRRAE